MFPATPGDTPGDIPGASRIAPLEFLKSFLAAAERPGDLGRLGEYHIRSVLGDGGMGVVLAAEDPQLRRTVAIKLMRPEIAALPAAKEHFLREARSAAKVEHPRIVVIHHVGEWNGTPYLVMPLLAGRSLGTRLKETPPIPLADAVRFAREAADGLAAAHSRGLIHRDIKPDNIWLEETAEGTHVRLLDFGLAHGDESDLLAHPGAIVGTPNYMAPEQAGGKPIDARADLFSFGCVLYEVLCGRKPFSGQSLMAVLKALASQHPAPVQELAPSVPGPLARLVMRLLEKNPARRPASASDVSVELRRFEKELAAAGDAVIIESSQPASYWFHVPRWMWGVAGTFLIGVVGVLGLMLPKPGELTSDNDAVFFQEKQSRFEASPPSPRPLAMAPTADQKQTESLQVTAIDVQLLTSTAEGDVSQGLLGKDSFTAAPGDRLQVTAKLSKPAYAFLVAGRPDGQAELCFPASDDTPPPLTDAPQTPLADGRNAYRLAEKTGLWVFAVVASETPLPAWRFWKDEHARELSIWKPIAAPADGFVWREDGLQRLESLSMASEQPVLLRAENEKLEGPAAAVHNLTHALRTTGQANAVSAIGFRVAPRE
jgi:serine/threonine protein kinase